MELQFKKKVVTFADLLLNMQALLTALYKQHTCSRVFHYALYLNRALLPSEYNFRIRRKTVWI
jgi:hypothetical protein